MVWAAPGRDMATLRRFFNALGDQRCAQITHVSADAADWIADVVAERCPAAIRCADPFHVVAWATEAAMPSAAGPGTTRGRSPSEAKWVAAPRQGTPRRGPAMSRRASSGRPLCAMEDPEDLTERRPAKLAWIARPTPGLYRAVCSNRAGRHALSVKGEEGKQALDSGSPGPGAAASRCSSTWPAASCASRAIHAALDHGLSQD